MLLIMVTSTSAFRRDGLAEHLKAWQSPRDQDALLWQSRVCWERWSAGERVYMLEEALLVLLLAWKCSYSMQRSISRSLLFQHFPPKGWRPIFTTVLDRKEWICEAFKEVCFSGGR